MPTVRTVRDMTATAEPSAAVPPPRPPRPGTVTVAFWLQLATVLILLGLVTLLVLAAVDWNDAIDKALRQVPDATRTRYARNAGTPS